MVISDYEVPSRPPLVVRPGDLVTVGDHDEQWPQFVFVTTGDGAGWVPDRYIDRNGTTGTVRVSYDTTELPGTAGQTVELVRDDLESGWAWCRNADGDEGWMPHTVLNPA